MVEEMEVPVIPSVTDEFLIENGELIVDTLILLNWFGYVGVPLLIIVSLFWVVYKQFLYTKI